MSRQVFNPYLPHYEYIPDAEPRIFENRLYIYGSHDRLGGKWFCENDYVTWSASLNDLSDWRYEGVIYTKQQDNRQGNLYAPDVIQGTDGRYYLYYSKDDSSVIGVAVCDTPAGKYEFYGEISYPDGRLLGDSEEEYFMFDPSILMDNGRIWLYSGSSVRRTTTKIKRNMVGCTVTELVADMITVKTPPKVVLEGTKSWRSEAYFEGPSARKIRDLYYIVYPVRNGSGLHYATSKYPDKGFIHQGSIHSTSDYGINGHSFFNLAYPRGNNHGGLVCVKGQWYVFDHRMTNNTDFSRQGIAEPITIATDGSISQVETTSCGLNGKPLKDEGRYPAYIACNLMSRKYFGFFRNPLKNAYVKQEGEDGEENAACYLSGIKRGYSAGYKYFNFTGGRYRITSTVRGGSGELIVATGEDGKGKLGSTFLSMVNAWKDVSLDCYIAPGKKALYFTYNGNYSIEMLNFHIEKTEN